MVEEIFFQSSMPRSGSTLFQNLMAQNPDFYVTPTSGVLELVFGARANYSNSPEFKAQNSELMKMGFLNFCREGMFGFYNGVTNKKYVLDKSRGWGVYKPFLNTFIPNAKVICFVRDIRSVVASYEKIYRANQHKQDPVRSDTESRGTTVHKRVDEWTHPQNTIGRAIERIFEMTRQGIDKEVLFIKYEDLCANPEKVMKKVYDYLEIPNFNHNFGNISQVTKEDDEIYGLGSGLHDIKSKLELPKPDYKDILGEDICKWLTENFKWYYEKFNYYK